MTANVESKWSHFVEQTLGVASFMFFERWTLDGGNYVTLYYYQGSFANYQVSIAWQALSSQIQWIRLHMERLKPLLKIGLLKIRLKLNEIRCVTCSLNAQYAP